MSRPAPLLTAEQMAELDRRTIEELGVPGLVLMENAAWACCEVLLERFPEAPARGVGIVCGPGNNGGDGFAMARRLHLLGVPVEVTLLTRLSRLSGDPARQADLAAAVGVTIREAPGSEPLAFASRRWRECGLLVDALFGTGLSRAVEGRFAAAVEAMEEARAVGARILSVDIPSGISGTTGAQLGCSVQADVTVTFAALKLGHVLPPGRTQCGDLVRADIGIPAERWLDLVPDIVHLVDAEALTGAVPPASRAAHKGTLGHLLVVAGGPGKAGAASLCAVAALRAGAGLVTLALPAHVEPIDLPPEVMVERYAPGDVDPLLEVASRCAALAVGPGLGTSPHTSEFVSRLFAEAPVPAVFDADGLNCLAGLSAMPERTVDVARVLTPHPGEMARLMTSPWEELAPRRVTVARQLALEAKATVALKGAGTVIATPAGTAWVNPTGNPGMATAGSGDVLTGIIGALLARGVGAPAATCAGVFWHGVAGDLARDDLGEPAVLASDISQRLGLAWRLAHAGGVAPAFESRP